VDLIVVNDGSTDGTQEVLDRENVVTARHLCNLGYGRTLQTAIEYARRLRYDALVKLDADGQHAPEELQQIIEAFMSGGWDLLIGSRFLEDKQYSGVPLGRRIGMSLFSFLVKLFTGQRVYDTTSGMKVFHRNVFEALTQWHFVDFHAETIVYLSRLGYRVGECPISVAERAHGESMYAPMSHITYPLKTCILIVLGGFQAAMSKRKSRQ
jgi:glycosyltransferase involved in cell wall biosynthesis